jgi:hypothetical protein
MSDSPFLRSTLRHRHDAQATPQDQAIFANMLNAEHLHAAAPAANMTAQKSR